MNCPFKTKPRWARRKDARPQELLAAALDLFVDRGYAATRLDDVAHQAGVSKGTLYLYFANKEDLFKAVVRENVVPVLDKAEEIVAGFEGDTRALLHLIMHSWWEQIGNTKLSGITKLMTAESSNFPEVAQFYHDEVITRCNAMIVGALRRGVERGEFRAVDLEHATLVVVAPMLMLMIWKHSFIACQPEPINADAYLACYVDLLLNGLVAPTAPPLPAAVCCPAQ